MVLAVIGVDAEEENESVEEIDEDKGDDDDAVEVHEIEDNDDEDGVEYNGGGSGDDVDGYGGSKPTGSGLSLLWGMMWRNRGQFGHFK
ncbi:uncharacterized protein [Arachis hypogaea]|uniref:uncharacterized protein n=1 Tax=Arachis hypogaea TaxID=3818 RepID=UPI0010FC5C3F|nr:acidic leucine-rich nuclear phosphoprotein 32-related protein-like [Arachis hypogaea]